MPTKFLNISTDNTLGGANAADDIVSSQKAIKTYVDNNSGGLSNHDFTHTANTTVTSPFTFTCSANQRTTQMITTSANLTLSIDCSNSADNYLWVKNSEAADIDVVISTSYYMSNEVPAASIFLPSDGISVPAGGICEIGIIGNADGLFITSRSDLGPNS